MQGYSDPVLQVPKLHESFKAFCLDSSTHHTATKCIYPKCIAQFGPELPETIVTVTVKQAVCPVGNQEWSLGKIVEYVNRTQDRN